VSTSDIGFRLASALAHDKCWPRMHAIISYHMCRRKVRIYLHVQTFNIDLIIIKDGSCRAVCIGTALLLVLQSILEYF
jgi:hypothetical protein